MINITFSTSSPLGQVSDIHELDTPLLPQAPLTHPAQVATLSFIPNSQDSGFPTKKTICTHTPGIGDLPYYVLKN